MKLTLTVHSIEDNMDYNDILDCLKKDEIIIKGRKYGIRSATFSKQHGAELEVIERT